MEADDGAPAVTLQHLFTLCGIRWSLFDLNHQSTLLGSRACNFKMWFVFGLGYFSVTLLKVILMTAKLG